MLSMQSAQTLSAESLSYISHTKLSKPEHSKSPVVETQQIWTTSLRMWKVHS